MPSARVLIVENHASLADLLLEIMQREPDLEIIGKVDSFAATLTIERET